MTPKKGIDVSTHNGIIDWEKVKNNIDFAIIRAGYGYDNLDTKFKINADECTRLNIPFGVYWFSYAYTVGMAEREADCVCEAIKEYNLTYPVCFDYEGESANYASKNGVAVTKPLLIDMAKAFLNRVEENGYYATLYSNRDYLNKGFSELTNRYDLWLAHWGVAEPSTPCGMWQSTSDGSVEGINGRVDIDFAYKDYPTLIKNMQKEKEPENKKEKELETLKQEKWELYYALANEVIDGKWGNGNERKTSLKQKGYDYDYIQAIVNILVY